MDALLTWLLEWCHSQPMEESLALVIRYYQIFRKPSSKLLVLVLLFFFRKKKTPFGHHLCDDNVFPYIILVYASFSLSCKGYVSWAVSRCSDLFFFLSQFVWFRILINKVNSYYFFNWICYTIKGKINILTSRRSEVDFRYSNFWH